MELSDIADINFNVSLKHPENVALLNNAMLENILSLLIDIKAELTHTERDELVTEVKENIEESLARIIAGLSVKAENSSAMS